MRNCNRLKYKILSGLCFLVFGCNSVVCNAAIKVTFTGATKEVLEERPDVSTGLNAVFVAYDASQIRNITITGADVSNITVQKFSSLGGGYAQEIPVRVTGNEAYVDNPEGDMGYIIDCGNEKYYFWLVDYEWKEFSVNSVTDASQQECHNTKITVEGNGGAIHYYSINGRQCTLSRDIKASYQNLVWDDDQKNYVITEQSTIYDYLTNPLLINPPLYCNSVVTVSGDKFLKQWGELVSAESNLIIANGVDARTEAVQNNVNDEEGSNMITSDGSMLGGSAPADFTFYAYPTDAVIHDEWQMADDPDFEYIRYRFYERDLSYVFTEEGKYYLRYIGSDASGDCTVISDSYEIGIGASDLRIPNAFSPDGDGVNDVWKVGYRSLVEFKCWIFDRNGRELCHFESPDKGWDGKYHGKVVTPGVYYYVIEAKGADGKKYKKGGDINIIKYRKIGNSIPSSGE